MSEDRPASRTFLATLFAVALILRVGAMLALATASVKSGTSAWDWGHEPACIAQALIEGRGYSDPWGHGTGATSWLTPPFPLLLAGLFEVFGGVNSTTAMALYVAQACASAVTCLLLVELGRAAGSTRAGQLAGWLFALYPIAISNSVQLVWDTTFVAAALCGAMVLLLRVRADVASPTRAGLGFGALLFLNPAPMSLIPIVLWHVARRAQLRGALVFTAGALAVCLPWLVRNQLVLGSFSLRPNFGVEMRIGNHAEANGRPVPFRYHPSHVESELALYRELGEVDYARENSERAMKWITTNPAAFTRLTLKRMSVFWFSEAPTRDQRRAPGVNPAHDPASWIKYLAYLALAITAWLGVFSRGPTKDSRLLFAGTMILFGAPYYLSHVSERYRFPIDPLLVLFTAWWILAVSARWRVRTQP